ncbi:hypothetical protein BKA63DRAFT_411359, partial [Paraphoma chrysanthemicola]
NTNKFSTIRNDLNSPLLRLPGEIRNLIYGYVLCEGSYEIRHSWRNLTFAFYIQRKVHYRLSLLAVCRRTYEETALLSFSLNKFSFVETYALEEYLIRNLHVAQRNAIRSIGITVFPGFDDSEEIKVNSAYSHLDDFLPTVDNVLVTVQFYRDWNVRKCDGLVKQAKKTLDGWLVTQEAGKIMKVLYKEVAF